MMKIAYGIGGILYEIDQAGTDTLSIMILSVTEPYPTTTARQGLIGGRGVKAKW